ncbi:MAG: prenyltransferase/squalene oxidase repeat-containing protein, partial [Planctomycetota bacterium]
MTKTYPVLILFISVCLLLRDTSSVCAQGGLFEPVTPSTKAAIRRGLEFLKSQQNKNGSFGSGYQIAATSLAGLAFLGYGNTYNRGEFSEQVKKTLNYILSCQDKWGYIDDNQCRMHGHGYATLFLAEVYGSLPPEYEKRVKRALILATDVIRKSQSNDGGWYYYPSHAAYFNNSDEGSVTITQVQALRAARNVGINVPKDVIERGKLYVKKCMGPNGCRYTIKG